MVENNKEKQDHVWKILWSNKNYLDNKVLMGTIDEFEIRGTSSELDSKVIDAWVSNLSAIYSIDDRFANSINASANELLENSLKHSYKFADTDKSGKLNIITLGVLMFPSHFHVYCITRYADINIDKISEKLSQNVSKTNIVENDALKTGAGGRGFLMTKLLSDMIYVNQDSVSNEFGFFKVRYH